MFHNKKTKTNDNFHSGTTSRLCKVTIDSQSMFNNPLAREQVDCIGSLTVATVNGHNEKVIPHESQMSEPLRER